MDDPVDLDALFKRLHLANARRIWPELCRRAEVERWTFEKFVSVLVQEEVAHRAKTRISRLVSKAELPFLKTIDEFNFTFQSTLRMQMLGSFLSPDFVTDGRSLILSGKTGRGKTHLAVAIAYRAIQNGFDALFTSCAALIDDLSAAAGNKGRFRDALARYTHPHVLVIDEVGYLSYSSDAANVLFHVVNDRYTRRKAMVFTTNKALRDWGRVLHDADLAHVILDRVLERGRHIKLDGRSGRTPDLDLDAELGQVEDGARITGTLQADFPEPTCRANDCAASQAAPRAQATQRGRSRAALGCPIRS
jgi:DNA replication protein DnaC